MKRERTTSVGRQNLSLRDGRLRYFGARGFVLLSFLTVIAGTVIVTLALPDKYEWRMKMLVKNQARRRRNYSRERHLAERYG